MKKFLPLLLLTPTIANAECTPAPDCASIGYTQTSCETLSLKCPFDQSKLYCFPCDSSYQYPCSKPNEYGDGESCNNKYKSCCNTDCIVGAIYYSDKTCNTCLDTNKTPVGIIVKDNELVMSLRRDAYIYWASNISIDTSLENMTEEQARTDYNGKINTKTIVAAYSNDTPDNNAAIYCNEFAPKGMENTKGWWYLPAAGELQDYVYGNYSILLAIYTKYMGYSDFNYWFWSSTEISAEYVWNICAYDNYLYERNKSYGSSICCFLTIN